jgi:5-methylcytosine-specific restriction endonuclease McrA
MKNYPYKLQVLVWFSDRCELSIVGMDEEFSFSFFNHMYPDGLTEDIVQFICEHGKCSFCGSKIKTNLDRCDCNHPDLDDVHLKVSYPTKLDKSMMTPILKRERIRRVNHIRQNRIKENGGVFTRKQVDELLEIQEQLCYYCGAPFENNNKFIAHADHYTSIHDGGANDIKNIVMACVSCNSKKGSMNGLNFEKLIKKTRPLEVSRKLGVVRRRLNLHLKQLKASGQ